MTAHAESPVDASTIYQRPVELLQKLIRFDTTNPPGNEAPCIAYVNELLTAAGFETNILTREEPRANLVTRLPGQGLAPPLLMYGHVDVVTTADQPWTQAAFEGKVLDGYVWGRGTLDMKGAVAMMLAALLRAKAEGLAPAGDVVLAILKRDKMESLDRIFMGTAVTNLTRMDFPRSYGALELECLFMKPGGAFPLVNVNLVLGAVTCAGKLGMVVEYVEDNIDVKTMDRIKDRALEMLLNG